MTAPAGVQLDADVDADREPAGLVEEVLTRWDDATSLYREMALCEDVSDVLTPPTYERMP
jgi:hypothetical protein